MKSLTALQTGNTATTNMPVIKAGSGRVTRHPPHRADGESAEMKMYLSKLKDLVPFMPKNRKLSKLEIIQHVIDYICDLQTELETHPEAGNFDAAAALQLISNASAAATTDEDISSEHDIDDDDEEMSTSSSRLVQSEQQQRQITSSPATTTRQPLVDRQAPNTILSSAEIAELQQQQQLSAVIAIPAKESSSRQQPC